jgi:hypothetical protein
LLDEVIEGLFETSQKLCLIKALENANLATE